MGKTITLNHITKIEGHAKLRLGVEKNKVTVCELSSTEGSRYFEGIVINRKFNEAHEMTSRICGICSCAHVIAAITAIENACGYTPSPQTKELRVLMTLAERIRSHATHLYFLALPDYLGYESALAMAPKYKKELKNALSLMKIGNELITLLGSRELHPVSATPGGWLKLPSTSELRAYAKKLKEAKKDALKTCELFFSLEYPHFESETQSFSLVDPKGYAVLEGVFSSEKLAFERATYRKHIEEYNVEHSSANFVTIKNKRFMVGALSRLKNNHKQLSKDASRLLTQSPISLKKENPYENNLAQAIELVHCLDHAISICSNVSIQPEKPDDIKPKAGIGVGGIEVPRGTLWHEYQLDRKGVIKKANIITPTAQNLLNIQEDIRGLIPHIIEKPREDIIMDVEKLIRCYDPCFSCSAHFLEVNWL